MSTTFVRQEISGTPEGTFSWDIPERFAGKFIITDSCWVWTGARTSSGYGAIRVHGVLEQAHRVAFQAAYEYLPEFIDHRCAARACVNPFHLREVTKKENMEHRTGPNRNSSSGVRGVTWDKARGKWRAKIGHHGRTIDGGLFESIADAEAAAVELRARYFTADDHGMVSL